MSIQLNSHSTSCEMSVFESILKRRSVRAFSDRRLSFQELSDLIYYSCGKTGSKQHQRSSPSAGGIHPIHVYVIVGDVENVEQGIYKYNFDNESLEIFREGDVRNGLSKACLGQKALLTAPATILFAVDFEKIGRRYGERKIKYGAMDCGHYGQNVYLACEALGLCTVAVGAFSDDELAQFMSLPENETPYYLFPIGEKA